jgi:hypothetical protein
MVPHMENKSKDQDIPQPKSPTTAKQDEIKQDPKMKDDIQSKKIPLFNPNVNIGLHQGVSSQGAKERSNNIQSNGTVAKPVSKVEYVEKVEVVRPVGEVELVRPLQEVEYIYKPSSTHKPEGYSNYVIENFTDDKKNYFINKPAIINSDKTLDANIYSIMGFSHKLSSSQQQNVSKYLQCNSCHDSKNNPKIHTITEQDIMHVKDEAHNKMEVKELHDRMKCKKLLKHEESTNENNSNHPNNKLDKKKVLDTLINDINKKKYNPCIKVEYRIENGKIIKKRMELPNCKNCTNSQCSTPILQPADVYDKCNEEGTSNNSLPTNINHPEHNNPETCISRDTKTTPAHSQCIQHTPKHTPIYKPTKSHSKCTATVSTQHPNCIKPTTNPLKCILPKLTEKKSGLCNLPFNVK